MRFHKLGFTAVVFAALVSLFAVQAQAAQWQKIASGAGESVELDLSRVVGTDNGRVEAWSRLVLKKAVGDAESGTAYNAVEVLNSYDCGGKRYTAVKRLYLDDEKVLKVEPIYGDREQTATAGMDAALLKEVCRHRPVVAASPAKAGEKKGAEPSVESKDAKFSVMHAEFVTDGKSATGKPVKEKVSDKAAEKTADKASDAAKTEPPKRMIDLPKIDKSQVEKPTDTKPGEKVADKPADKAADKVVEKGATRSASLDVLNNVDKRTRELTLATSGPRRVARKPATKAAEPALAHAEIHWAYEGDGAPANWAKLDEKNALCASGKRQSPIDIGDSIKVDLEGIRFDYKPTLFRIEDNGHTIQVTPAEGNTIKVMGRTYELKQLHFHRPSEEKVGGKRFDMVVHLVHKDDDGNLAVVAVLLEKGEQEQALIQTLWNNMPLEVGQSLSPSTPIDLNKLLPADRAYYTYMGSLTTPPCSEGVLWMVFKQPVAVTPEQVSVFSRLYRNNARPIQPGFGRLVKESR